MINENIMRKTYFYTQDKFSVLLNVISNVNI